MTLPQTPPISWTQICAEFGLNPATAVFPNSLYGLSGLQSSGPMSFFDLLGRTKVSNQVSIALNPASQSFASRQSARTFPETNAVISGGIASSYNWSITNASGGNWVIQSGQGTPAVVVRVSGIFLDDTAIARLNLSVIVNGTTYSTYGGLHHTYLSEINCVAADSFFPTGHSADSVGLGYEMLALDYNNMDRTIKAPIQRYALKVADCARIVSKSGISLVASKTTPVTLRNGFITNILDVSGKQLAVQDSNGFRWEEIVSVEDAGIRGIAHIYAGGATFAAGEEPGRMIFTHNVDKQ